MFYSEEPYFAADLVVPVITVKPHLLSQWDSVTVLKGLITKVLLFSLAWQCVYDPACSLLWQTVVLHVGLTYLWAGFSFSLFVIFFLSWNRGIVPSPCQLQWCNASVWCFCLHVTVEKAGGAVAGPGACLLFVPSVVNIYEWLLLLSEWFMLMIDCWYLLVQ